MATLGNLTTLKIGSILVGELTNIGQIEQTLGKVDVTTLNDTHRKYIPGGVKDTNDISIEGNYEKSEVGQVAMKTAYANKTTDTYIITFPTGATWTVKGFITNLVILGGAEVNDTTLNFTATIAVSEEPVFAEAV